MYKLVVLAALMAVATAAPGLVSPWGAGLVGSPVLGGSVLGGPVLGGSVVGAPILRSAPLVSHALPVATSYANSVRIAAPAVVAAPAPIVASHGSVIGGSVLGGPVLGGVIGQGW